MVVGNQGAGAVALSPPATSSLDPGSHPNGSGSQNCHASAPVPVWSLHITPIRSLKDTATMAARSSLQMGDCKYHPVVHHIPGGMVYRPQRMDFGIRIIFVNLCRADLR